MSSRLGGLCPAAAKAEVAEFAGTRNSDEFRYQSIANVAVEFRSCPIMLPFNAAANADRVQSIPQRFAVTSHQHILPQYAFLRSLFMSLNRRQLLLRAAGVSCGLAFAGFSRTSLRAAGSVASEKHFEITDVKRTTVKLEFRPTPRRNMDREIPHWRYTELCDVTLKCGATGTGETLLFYTWGVPDDADVQRVIGRSALEVMWDDSLGAGLQMAIFDAVGRAAEVPVHALLGHQVHEKTPLSWWNIDTSAADMASECAEAARLGYKSYKTKGRPWFDLFQQLDATVKVIPSDFKIDMDFNDTLRTAERGLPILKKMEQYPNVDIFEGPIPQSDVEAIKRSPKQLVSKSRCTTGHLHRTSS